MIINNFQFLIFSMWKETERCQGIGLWSPVGLDYRTSTGLGKQTLAGCKQNLVYTRTQKGDVTPQETESDLPVSVRSLWWRYGSTVACCRVEALNTTSPFEGECHYCHYSYHSLDSGLTTRREHSPAHQQKIGLKIYWWALSNRTLLTEPYNPRNNNLFIW